MGTLLNEFSVVAESRLLITVNYKIKFSREVAFAQRSDVFEKASIFFLQMIFLLLIINFFYNLIGRIVFITQKIRSKEMSCTVRVYERNTWVRFAVGRG